MKTSSAFITGVIVTFVVFSLIYVANNIEYTSTEHRVDGLMSINSYSTPSKVEGINQRTKRRWSFIFNYPYERPPQIFENADPGRQYLTYKINKISLFGYTLNSDPIDFKIHVNKDD